MVKFLKKIVTDPKNYDIKEEFLCIQLISHVIGYPSIDPWNSLETYGPPCIIGAYLKCYSNALKGSKEHGNSFFPMIQVPLLLDASGVTKAENKVFQFMKFNAQCCTGNFVTREVLLAVLGMSLMAVIVMKKKIWKVCS